MKFYTMLKFTRQSIVNFICNFILKCNFNSSHYEYCSLILR